MLAAAGGKFCSQFLSGRLPAKVHAVKIDMHGQGGHFWPKNCQAAKRWSVIRLQIEQHN